VKRIAILAVVGLVWALGTQPAMAAGKGYVVSAAHWGQAQEEAVSAAGGTVTFGHDGTGIGVVESDAPDFAARLRASGVVTRVDEDMMVQWQGPVHEVQLDENAVNPNDDTFYQYIQWAPQAVGAPAAWAAGFTGKGVRVAIVDGGIRSTHLDLVANLDVAASRSFVPGFAFNQDVGTFWHGTHVAGIVAAADNSLGTVGIAPEATIFGAKALHNGSGQFGWVISAILYSATPLAEGGGGADIINMSLGAVFERGGGNTGAGPLVAALNKAVNYADRHGVLVVSAAGNDALDLDHSGSYISVPAQSGSGIAVSATGPVAFAYGATNFRRVASYTNYGNSAINVAAPGGDFVYPTNELCTLPTTTGSVTIPCWAFDMVLSTSRGSGASNTSYTWAAGTSMAAPAAAAVAALIKQANPGISLGALKTKLQQSADDEGKKGNDPYYGKGFVNAAKAVAQ
jgi:lantibiotic leader peptide-processing serine protease